MSFKGWAIHQIMGTMPAVYLSKEYKINYFEAKNIDTSNEILKDLLNHPEEIIKTAALKTLIKKKKLKLFT